MMNWLPRWIVEEVVEEVDKSFKRRVVEIIQKSANNKHGENSGMQPYKHLTTFEYARIARAVWERARSQENTRRANDTKPLVKEAVKHFFDNNGVVLWEHNTDAKHPDYTNVTAFKPKGGEDE